MYEIFYIYFFEFSHCRGVVKISIMCKEKKLVFAVIISLVYLWFACLRYIRRKMRLFSLFIPNQLKVLRFSTQTRIFCMACTTNRLLCTTKAIWFFISFFIFYFFLGPADGFSVKIHLHVDHWFCVDVCCMILFYRCLFHARLSEI